MRLRIRGSRVAVDRAADAGPAGRRQRNPAVRKFLESAFIWPMLVLLGVLVLIPTVIAIYRSFFQWNPGYSSPFVGLANYLEIVGLEVVHEIARNELFYMIGVPLWAGIPVVVALLLYERVPAPAVFRTIFMFPIVLSPVILGILFRAILRPDGIINLTLESVGLGALARNWIDDPALVKPVIILVVIWYSMGFGVLFYSAALSTVPIELFESAEIDGATWFQRLRYVMIPAILPMFLLNLIFSIGTVFLLFGYVFVLTEGGPGYSSTTIDYHIYLNAMSLGYFGTSAAEGVMLLVIMLVILYLTTIIGRRLWR